MACAPCYVVLAPEPGLVSVKEAVWTKQVSEERLAIMVSSLCKTRAPPATSDAM